MLEWLSRGSDGEPPALDRGYLDRLEKHLGARILTELLADGLIEITDRLVRLAEAGAEGDAPEIGRIGHDIAGVAGHLGLTGLSQAAVAMNRSLRTTPDRCPAERLEAVLATGTRGTEALRAHLAERNRTG